MQNFILISLVIGLGFFLYLLQTGEIDSNTFNIRNLQGDVRFDIVQSEDSGSVKSSSIKLNVKGTEYAIYNFTGIDFNHIPKSEYYMKIYNVPLEAKDAISGIWLGSRYVFYVTQEEIDGSQTDVIYKIYKAEYPTDSLDPVEYTQYKTVRGVSGSNRLEVTY